MFLLIGVCVTFFKNRQCLRFYFYTNWARMQTLALFTHRVRSSASILHTPLRFDYVFLFSLAFSIDLALFLLCTILYIESCLQSQVTLSRDRPVGLHVIVALFFGLSV